MRSIERPTNAKGVFSNPRYTEDPYEVIRTDWFSRVPVVASERLSWDRPARAEANGVELLQTEQGGHDEGYIAGDDRKA